MARRYVDRDEFAAPPTAHTAAPRRDRPRDGDGDGFVFDGTPRMRPYNPLTDLLGKMVKPEVVEKAGRGDRWAQADVVKRTRANVELARKRGERVDPDRIVESTLGERPTMSDRRRPAYDAAAELVRNELGRIVSTRRRADGPRDDGMIGDNAELYRRRRAAELFEQYGLPSPQNPDRVYVNRLDPPAAEPPGPRRDVRRDVAPAGPGWRNGRPTDDQLREAFTVDLGDGYSTEAIRTDGDGLVEGIILDADGVEVGSFKRRVAENAPVVEFESLKLHRDHQGNGVGHRLFAQQVEAMRALGAERVDVYAASWQSNGPLPGEPQNGAYTWARFGYDWAPGSTSHILIARDLEMMSYRGVGSPEDRAAADEMAVRLRQLGEIPTNPADIPDDFPTPNDVAMLGWVPDAESWFGRDLMSGRADPGRRVGFYGSYLLTDEPSPDLPPSRMPDAEQPTPDPDMPRGPDLSGMRDATPDQVRDAARAAGGPIMARAADNRRSRSGILRGDGVQVEYVNDDWARVRNVQANGRTRAYRVRWDRFNGIDTTASEPPATYTDSPEDIRAAAKAAGSAMIRARIGDSTLRSVGVRAGDVLDVEYGSDLHARIRVTRRGRVRAYNVPWERLDGIDRTDRPAPEVDTEGQLPFDAPPAPDVTPDVPPVPDAPEPDVPEVPEGLELRRENDNNAEYLVTGPLRQPFVDALGEDVVVTFRQSKGTQNHRVGVSVPGKGDVTSMNWHSDDGEIEGLVTAPAFQRQGMATRLFDMARALSADQGIVEPRHSDRLTDDGAAWRRAMEGRDGDVPEPNPELDTPEPPSIADIAPDGKLYRAYSAGERDRYADHRGAKGAIYWTGVRSYAENYGDDIDEIDLPPLDDIADVRDPAVAQQMIDWSNAKIDEMDAQLPDIGEDGYTREGRAAVRLAREAQGVADAGDPWSVGRLLATVGGVLNQVENPEDPWRSGTGEKRMMDELGWPAIVAVEAVEDRDAPEAFSFAFRDMPDVPEPDAPEPVVDTPTTGVNGVVDAVRALGAELDLVERDSSEGPYLELGRIVVPPERRNEGLGGQAMTLVTAYADETGADLFLTPSADFGGSKSRLERWYRSLGFVPNKGRNKDFRSRETMVRRAEAPAPDPIDEPDIPEPDIPEPDEPELDPNDVRGNAQRGRVSARIADRGLVPLGIRQGDTVDVEYLDDDQARVFARTRSGRVRAYDVSWDRLSGPVGDPEGLEVTPDEPDAPRPVVRPPDDDAPVAPDMPEAPEPVPDVTPEPEPVPETPEPDVPAPDEPPDVTPPATEPVEPGSTADLVRAKARDAGAGNFARGRVNTDNLEHFGFKRGNNVYIEYVDENTARIGKKKMGKRRDVPWSALTTPRERERAVQGTIRERAARIAEQQGVPVEVAEQAIRDLPGLRDAVKGDIEAAADDAFGQLEAGGIIQLSGPPKRVWGLLKSGGSGWIDPSGGEWDWFWSLSPREQARLRRNWFNGTTAPDEVSLVAERVLGTDDTDEAMQWWLRQTRMIDAAAAIKRGKMPAHADKVDLDGVAASLNDEGVTVADVFGRNPDDAAAVLAARRHAVDAAEREEFALRALGDSVRGDQGERPWELGRDEWVERVSALEYRIGQEADVSDAELDEYDFLAPPDLRDGGELEDVWQRIRDAARDAGFDVPADRDAPGYEGPMPDVEPGVGELPAPVDIDAPEPDVQVPSDAPEPDVLPGQDPALAERAEMLTGADIMAGNLRNGSIRGMFAQLSQPRTLSGTKLHVRADNDDETAAALEAVGDVIESRGLGAKVAGSAFHARVAESSPGQAGKGVTIYLPERATVNDDTAAVADALRAAGYRPSNPDPIAGDDTINADVGLYGRYELRDGAPDRDLTVDEYRDWYQEAPAPAPEPDNGDLADLELPDRPKISDPEWPDYMERVRAVADRAEALPDGTPGKARALSLVVASMRMDAAAAAKRGDMAEVDRLRERGTALEEAAKASRVIEAANRAAELGGQPLTRDPIPDADDMPYTLTPNVAPLDGHAFTSPHLGELLTSDETVDQLEQVWASAPDDMRIAVPVSALDAVLSEGRWRTQHEVESSRGAYNPAQRRRHETDMGVPEDIPDAQRPVFGFVGDRQSRNDVSQYGEVVFKVRPKVAGRTTLTFGDSLSGPGGTVPLAADTDRAQLAGAVTSVWMRDRGQTADRLGGFGYNELQFHGGLTTDDVEPVVEFQPFELPDSGRIPEVTHLKNALKRNPGTVERVRFLPAHMDRNWPTSARSNPNIPTLYGLYRERAVEFSRLTGLPVEFPTLDGGWEQIDPDGTASALGGDAGGAVVAAMPSPLLALDDLMMPPRRDTPVVGG